MMPPFVYFGNDGFVKKVVGEANQAAMERHFAIGALKEILGKVLPLAAAGDKAMAEIRDTALLGFTYDLCPKCFWRVSKVEGSAGDEQGFICESCHSAFPESTVLKGRDLAKLAAGV